MRPVARLSIILKKVLNWREPLTMTKFIISGTLQIIGVIILSVFLSILLPLVFEHANIEEEWVMIWVVPFIRTIAVVVVLLISIPSIIGGLGILNKKKWALTLALILGCF